MHCLSALYGDVVGVYICIGQTEYHIGALTYVAYPLERVLSSCRFQRCSFHPVDFSKLGTMFQVIFYLKLLPRVILKNAHVAVSILEVEHYHFLTDEA